jgi:hypothetical protein
VSAISKSGSQLSAWPTEPAYDNEEGIINFSGTGDAYTGANGRLVRITFAVKSALKGDVHIASGALLAMNGQSTNILSTMRGAIFTLIADDVLPSTPPESPAPQVKGAAISVPTISPFDASVRAGNRIVVQGTASPNSDLTVLYARDKTDPGRIAVHASPDGTYTAVVPEVAHGSLYELWAVAKGDGGETFNSETISVPIRNDLVAALGTLGESAYALWMAAALAFICAVLIVVMLRR